MKEKEKLIKHLEYKCDQLTLRNKYIKAELSIVKNENKKLGSKSSQRIEIYSQQKSENHNDLNQHGLHAFLPTTTPFMSSSPRDPSETSQSCGANYHLLLHLVVHYHYLVGLHPPYTTRIATTLLHKVSRAAFSVPLLYFGFNI